MLTYVSSPSEYGSDCLLESKQLTQLTPREEVDLFQYLLSRLDAKEILNQSGWFSLKQVKEEKNIAVSNHDQIWIGSRYGIENFAITETKLSERTLNKLENSACFIQVTMPKWILNQLQKSKESKESRKKLTDQQKLDRKLKKAEKLLKDAGKL